jgi:hypothetical protein
MILKSIPTKRLPSLLPLTLLAAASSIGAQSWAVATTSPTAPFTSPAIANDGTSVLLVDEGSNGTFELVGGTWSLLAPSLLHTANGTSIGHGGFVYRFGGSRTVGGLTNDIFRFDRATGGWVQLTPVPTAPTPREFAIGTGINASTSIIFGGVDAATSTLLQETWQCTDVVGANPIWLQLATPAAMSPRIFATMARGPGNTAVLFGGVNGVGGTLGDTWILAAGVWTQYVITATSPAPAPTAFASMTFDPARNMTTLIHPNGQTWEWNGFAWRLVGTIGAALVQGAQAAFDATAGTVIAQQFSTASELLAYTPSPASFAITMPNPQCFAGAPQSFRLASVSRSLPILGQSLELRLDRVSTAALLIGAFEFASGTVTQQPCNCLLGLTLTGATQFVPNTAGVGNWSLPIANNPALFGIGLDMQGFAFDPAIPCQVAGTQRATAVMGR